MLTSMYKEVLMSTRELAYHKAHARLRLGSGMWRRSVAKSGLNPTNSELASGAHAATASAPILGVVSTHVWLGGTALGKDSFPLTDGGHLPADRMFRAALTSRS
jgi:hypothetical protein